MSLIEQATSAIINAVQTGQLTDEIRNEADEAVCSTTSGYSRS
jgi:hypothetical protein